MSDVAPSAPASEWIEIEELDAAAWNDYAIAQGWSDGFPTLMPTEAAVARMLEGLRGDNKPLPAISPRQVVPSLASLAANAVMAGCRADYFPVVVAALRAVTDPAYNLHGTLATTHPCAQMLLLNGPVRQALEINSGGNCFGQGWRANATIGRALQLILVNIVGAKPGIMDRSTQGSPAKYAFCFGENEEQSPWEPYHVRRGFAAEDSVVTALPAEAPHNINDHGSNDGAGIMTTIAGTISQVGANTIYRNAPYFVVLGPEHAQTLHRDGWTIADMQAQLYEQSKVHISRVSKDNQKNYEERDQEVIAEHYYLTQTPEDIHLLVAGGPGKHSAYIASFGFTSACSVRIPQG